MAATYKTKLEKSFTGTGADSNTVALNGAYNLSLSGFGSATVAWQRSFDGSTWFTVQSISADAQLQGDEPEMGVVYRFNCTAHSSGTIACRVSQ